jgi:RNase P protein component
MTAFEAFSQMHPLRADFQAVFAASRARRESLFYVVEVNANFHG